MSLGDFSGKTYVAFIDISGFKKMVKNGSAQTNLKEFYKSGYELLEENYSKSIINGIFISDCGIVYVKNSCENNNQKITLDNLVDLFYFVRKMNINMLKKDIMLTTSIAYGDFNYIASKEHRAISKNNMYGEGYIKAYLDSERRGQKKIHVGEVRLLKENVLDEVIKPLTSRSSQLFGPDATNVKKKIQETEDYLYYYWMVNNGKKIDDYKKDFKNAPYLGYLKVLKDYSLENNQTN